ncbi:hypothetical protein PG984_005387 [Apiospora sp. TS-2023a]
MKFPAALFILAGSVMADDQDPPLDANGEPFPAVWVQVAETSYYCYADNCARAVTGTRTAADMPPQASRQADCSSYMHTTVTPAPVTTTTWTYTVEQVKRDVATAVVLGDEPLMQARGAAPTIPIYASFCTEQFPGATPHYSSACNCWSITASTTTLPPETITATATATTTETVTSAEGKPTCYQIGSAYAYQPCYTFQSCTSSSQCAQGSSCAFGYCCGYGICTTSTAGSNCPNPSFARAIFARKQDARADVARSAAAPYDDDDEEEDEDEEGGGDVDDGEDGEDGEEDEDVAVAAAAPTEPPRLHLRHHVSLGPAKAFAARRRRGEIEAAAPPAPVSTYTSVIMCPLGPCGTTTLTVEPQTTTA